MKKYSIFHIPVFSFFSTALYRDVCRNWRGTCLLYLFLLLTLCWIPYVVKLHLGLSNFVLNEAPKVVSQLPKMTVNKGELTVDATQPYNIADPVTGKILVIIDTTGKTAGLEGDDVVCLVKKNEVIIRKSKYERRSFDLKPVDHFYLDKDRVTRWLEIFRKYFAICLFPLALGMSFTFRIFQMLIYACIGLLFASMCNSKISYLPLLRLSVVAVTPCIIIRTVFDLSGIHIPFAGLLSLIMTMVYLYIGVKASAAVEEYPKGNL
ncbi:MAG: DUF1189 family protein [Victivallales bacterium]|jgi:hypothetical protein